jgi:hypothetical protein
MKIYLIDQDYDYQYFLPDMEKVSSPKMDGLPLPHAWEPPPFFILKPNLKKGNFVCWFGCSGLLIFDNLVRNKLLELFEMSGELFRFHYKNESFTLFNPLNVLDVLDDRRSEIKRLPSGGIYEIKKYAFHEHRLTEIPIFKIPEEKTSLFTIEGMKNPEDEFKYRVESLGFTGLKFKEVWSDQ